MSINEIPNFTQHINLRPHPILTEPKKNMSSTTPIASAGDIAKHGWTAVPVDAGEIFGNRPYQHKPPPIDADEIPFPSADPIVAAVQSYAQKNLPGPAYNHSMRVYYFGNDPFLHQYLCINLQLQAITFSNTNFRTKPLSSHPQRGRWLAFSMTLAPRPTTCARPYSPLNFTEASWPLTC